MVGYNLGKVLSPIEEIIEYQKSKREIPPEVADAILYELKKFPERIPPDISKESIEKETTNINREVIYSSLEFMPEEVRKLLVNYITNRLAEIKALEEIKEKEK